MKILYDISILGAGSVSEKTRTGVFRVIENVAENLVLQPGCEITFCVENDINLIKLSIDYLKTSSSLASTPFSLSEDYDKRISLFNKREKLVKENGAQSSIFSLEKVLKKVEIRRLNFLEKFYFKNASLVHRKDISHSNVFHSPFFAVPAHIQQKKSIRSFLTIYDLIPVLYPQFFEQSIIDTVNKILESITSETWILCISQSTRNDLLNYLDNRVNPRQVSVTELAASNKFYPSTDKRVNQLVRKKYSIPDGPYVLSLCTLEPRKNIDQAIRAFVLLIQQEHISDLNLVLVGGKGWLFDKIFNEINTTTVIKNRIIITGFVADEDLAAIYSDALMFVYPSFYEGFGLPPLEAMQCGIPAITSNTSSLPEVVGDAGIMVSPNDLEELSSAMLSIYKSPDLRDKLAAKALTRAIGFSWGRCAEETVHAYNLSLE